MIFVVVVAAMVIFTRLMKGTRTIKSWIAYGLAPLLLIILSISVYREMLYNLICPKLGNTFKNPLVVLRLVG